MSVAVLAIALALSQEFYTPATMQLDYVSLWGLATATGFVFRPIVEHLALKTAEDFAKDYIKGCFKNVLAGKDLETITVAAGLAVKGFLQVVQDELEGAGYTEEQLAPFVEPLELFITDPEVAAVLGPALVSPNAKLDATRLANAWRELHMPELPTDFSWNRTLNRYQKVVTGIRREDQDLRDILNTQLLEDISSDIRSATAIGPDDDLARFQRAMQRTYAYLKLETLDATTYDLQRLRLDQVFIPQNVRECNEFLPQVFELPKELQKRLRTLDHVEGIYDQLEVDRFRKAYLQKAPRSISDLLQKQRFRLLVILGDPGSGKSSLLQREVLRWADLPRGEAEAAVVPLLVELDEYARNRREGTAGDFLEFLHKGTGIPARLDQRKIAERLAAGSASLLFDGIDEVFDPELRRTVVTDIARFANDYPRARIVVTSRVIGYKAQTLRDAGFEHFMLQDLSSKQIEEFLIRWHKLAYSSSSEGEAKRRSLKEALQESQAITELAGNPLLLTMMTILNRTQDLPRDRGELYNQCSRLLLYQWKADDAIRADRRFKGTVLDFKDKLAMLRRVAREMQGSEAGLAGNLIEEQALEDTLVRVLDEIGIQQSRLLSRAVIEQLRVRNFILCFVGAVYYSFVHRTFLEYFCASDFLWQFKEEQSLDFESLKGDVFGQHWQDETWHEVLCLISGMLVPRLAGEIIVFLLSVSREADADSAALLAGRCYSEVRNKAEIAYVATELRDRLQRVVEQTLVRRKDIAIQLNISIETKDPAELALIASRKSESTARIRQRRISALKQLGAHWRLDSGVFEWVLELAKKPSEPAMQETLFRTLADSWGDEPKTFTFFADTALSGPKPIMRLAALSHLLRRWPDDDLTRDIAIEVARSDKDSSVRVRAVQSLGSATGANLRIRAIIEELLEEDLNRTGTSSPIRKVCFQQLARLPDVTDKTMLLAKRGASSSAGLKVKKRILTIFKRRSDDPELPGLILQMIRESERRPKLKRVAENALLEMWPDSAEARCLGVTQ